jgi:hypothetical protein
MTETSRPTPRRPLAAVAAFALCAALFYAANLLAADVRYPLAIFCLVLSIASFVVGLCLISRRLGQGFVNLIAEIIDWWT